MDWYYVEVGKQAGPVDDAGLAELLKSGKILPETLVWHEGMANWQPYRDAGVVSAPPIAFVPTGPVPATVPLAANEAVCVECGRVFAQTEMIRYSEKWVCAACKPAFFQKLREGATLGAGAGDSLVSESDILARDYEVDIGGCLDHGWQVFKTNAGILIGASVLVYLVIMAVSLGGNLLPFIGILISMVLNGPLMGGLWIFYVKATRGQQVGVGDAFAGFGPRFGQLVLAQLIPGLVSLAVMFLLGIVFAAAIPALAALNRASGRSTMAVPHAMIIPMGIVVGVTVLAMIYITTCWVFALPLVGDKGLRFWPALELSRRVVNKHWWMTFALLLVTGLLAGAGLIACFLGMLVTGPTAFAMLATHYNKVFGDLAPKPT